LSCTNCFVCQIHMLLFCLDPYASLCSASAVWLLLLLVICLSKTQSAIPWWIITSPVEYHIPGGESHPQWSITSLVEYHIPMYMLFAAESLSASIPRTLSIAYESFAIHADNPKPNPMMNFRPLFRHTLFWQASADRLDASISD